MEKEITKVKPIVLYPKCMENDGIQKDCHICEDKDECIIYQPRAMCVKPYKNHMYGCPNFGRIPTCPPNNPCLYDQLFDISDVYAVVTAFNLEKFFEMRRKKYPNLHEGQIRNSRYWQPITKKENDYAVTEFYRENPSKKDYVATRLLECMGVDVFKTMKEVGLELKNPPEKIAYRISFVAAVYEEMLKKYGFEVYEETNKNKKGMKTLRRTICH